MNNAIIEENIPYCYKCKNLLGNTKDYRLVTVNGERYTEFVRYCSQRGCLAISKYLLDLDLEGNYRFTTDNKVEVVKDSGESKTE